LSVFCGCFFCSSFGFAAPFIMTAQPTRTRCHATVSRVGRALG
jgi:hypothetical protein